MRELKFRCWDVESKAMGPVVSLTCNEEKSYCIMFNGVECLGITHGEDGFIMQFTGLQDKNGKEIYEGDICTVRRYYYSIYDSSIWHVCEVLWGCESAWVFRAYYQGKGTGDFYGIRFPEANEIEVIGNIYEHPELLITK